MYPRMGTTAEGSADAYNVLRGVASTTGPWHDMVKLQGSHPAAESTLHRLPLGYHPGDLGPVLPHELRNSALFGSRFYMYCPPAIIGFPDDVIDALT